MESRQSLQKIVLGKLDRYMKKNSQITNLYKSKLKMKEDLNLSHETMKIVKENIDSKILDISCSNIFASMFPRAREVKEKIQQMGPQ